MSKTATHPGLSVRIRNASTRLADPSGALDALDAELKFSEADATILFVSARYDTDKLANEIAKRIKGAVLCCTTAGEISSEQGYFDGGMAAATVSGCNVQLIHLPKLSDLDDAGFEAIGLNIEPLDALGADIGAVGLVVFDALSRKEESIIEKLQALMPTVPLVGGSAGDDLKFNQTLVYHEGKFHNDAGTLLLLSGTFSVFPFQTHHFSSNGTRVVATRVDAASRKLIELDGIPAVARLAQIHDCKIEEITAERLFLEPLMLRFGDAYFVRSVYTVNADQSLSLLCAVDAGDVLHIGEGGKLIDTTALYFEALKHQRSTPDLVLGFDCILRRLELIKRGGIGEMNEVLREIPFIGFSTFGEQFDGMHVNQTMTGVALWQTCQ